MAISRRDFIRNSAIAGASTATLAGVSGCDSTSPEQKSILQRVIADPNVPTVFQHGIASGDPTQSAAIIWTRVTQRDEDGNFVPGNVDVAWEVCSDPEMTNRLRTGTFQATGANDYCVKADVTGLDAYTAYYYRFYSMGFESAVGRFQTMPDWGSEEAKRLRIAIVSCSSFPHGYFHVYNQISQRNDIDFVIHLGDYVYEYGDGEYGDIRTVDPAHEMISLDDYRRRHAHYKADPHLMALHQQYAFINVWDDHETTDNSRKCTANNHSEADSTGLSPDDPGFNEGYWYERRDFGIKAYFEWLPIRPTSDDVADVGELFAPINGKTWRKFSAGEFLDLIMIDTRIWGRDDETDAGANFTRENVRDYQSADPACGDTTVHRDILGPDQETWLHQQLQQSTAKWKVIGNQLIMSQLRIQPTIGPSAATYLNGDAWDGYPTSQERVYEILKGNNADGTENADQNVIDNTVVITGDIHTSWAFDVTANPDATALEGGYTAQAVEFVCPSVTSPGLPIPEAVASGLETSNAHLKYVNLDQHGWVLLDLAADYATGEWYHIGPDATIQDVAEPADAPLAMAFRTPSTAGVNNLELPAATDPTGAEFQTAPDQAYLDARPARAPEFTG